MIKKKNLIEVALPLEFANKSFAIDRKNMTGGVA